MLSFIDLTRLIDKSIVALEEENIKAEKIILNSFYKPLRIKEYKGVKVQYEKLAHHYFVITTKIDTAFLHLIADSEY